MNFDDVNIGGQLKIGTGIVPAIKEGDERINGSMYLSLIHISEPTRPY